MTLSRVRIFIKGFVQGVCFRFFVEDEANALGIKGYVRNTSDGKVEVVAEGEKNLIDKLVDSVKIGPTGASVSDVNVVYENYLGEFKDFRIKY